MDGAEPDTFNEWLTYTLKNTAMDLFQDLTVLQQYLKAMCIFIYDATDKTKPWKRNNGRWLVGAVKMVNTVFSSVP